MWISGKYPLTQSLRSVDKGLTDILDLEDRRGSDSVPVLSVEGVDLEKIENFA